MRALDIVGYLIWTPQKNGFSKFWPPLRENLNNFKKFLKCFSIYIYCKYFPIFLTKITHCEFCKTLGTSNPVYIICLAVAGNRDRSTSNPVYCWLKCKGYIEIYYMQSRNAIFDIEYSIKNATSILYRY